MHVNQFREVEKEKNKNKNVAIEIHFENVKGIIDTANNIIICMRNVLTSGAQRLLFSIVAEKMFFWNFCDICWIPSSFNSNFKAIKLLLKMQKMLLCSNCRANSDEERCLCEA